jgi:proteic killer suppression protein
MLVGFNNADTKLLWETAEAVEFPPIFGASALRKLMIVTAALELENLRVPPNNRLDELTRDRQGQHSIRINDQ